MDAWIVEERWPGEGDEALYTRLARGDPELIESWAQTLAEREVAMVWARASEKEKQPWRDEVRKRLDAHLAKLRSLPR